MSETRNPHFQPPIGTTPEGNPFFKTATLPPMAGTGMHSVMLAVCLASNAAAIIMLVKMAGAL